MKIKIEHSKSYQWYADWIGREFIADYDIYPRYYVTGLGKVLKTDAVVVHEPKPESNQLAHVTQKPADGWVRYGDQIPPSGTPLWLYSQEKGITGPWSGVYLPENDRHTTHWMRCLQPEPPREPSVEERDAKEAEVAWCKFPDQDVFTRFALYQRGFTDGAAYARKERAK